MRPRGAFPSPRHRLAAASPHVISGSTPQQVLYKPSQLSYWLNDQFGDCVTAEEAFAKACYNPEIFISQGQVKKWAKHHGVLNGANLINVLDMMRTGGFYQEGHTYNDGPATAVDWTNPSILQNAIANGPVKIGVAADQLENVVPDPPANGWFATGFKRDENEDHCVSIAGYGPISWLMAQLGGSVPSQVDGVSTGYAIFTWDSIGVMDWPSLQAITAEAWLRNPVTVIS